MSRLISIALLFTIALSISSCEKDNDANSSSRGKISNVPEIELVKISSSTLYEFENLTITIKYLDGDGDLGSLDADEKSVFVTDIRDSIVHEYHLQPLAPQGSNITIEGNLNIVVKDLIVLDNTQTFEYAQFSIYLRDQAGNTSNTIETGLISVSK